MSDSNYSGDLNQPKNPFAEKFPEMKPVTRAPSLYTLNGIGTTVVGNRDYDEETSTYVKTHTFAVFFIPLVALGAYRVADAPEGGWYFIGRVPLSSFARGWNYLMGVLALVGMCVGGWAFYTRTDEYKAGQTIARANDLAEKGKVAEAAKLFRDVMLGKTEKAATARERFDALLAEPPADLREAAGLFQIALDLHRQEKHQVKDLFSNAMMLVKKNEESDPQGALAVLETVAPLAGDAAEHLEPRRRLLDRLVAKSPDDVDLASRLASVCAEQGDLKRCRAVLERHEANLGEREGAALLGRIYAREGKLDQAHKLLSVYLDRRLSGLRAAEQNIDAAYQQAQQSIVKELQERKAIAFDFAKADAATEAERSRMIRDYLFQRLRSDERLQAAQKELAQYRGVVDAAIDLGLVQLHRGQGLADPQAREKELKKAEETFLAVQGSAGDTDRYRLSLGQVYYWLGKHAEGKKLFDELLKKNEHAVPLVMSVANVLREVGSVSEARKLLEAVYEKEATNKTRQQIALARSLMMTDLDDKILWLERADAGDFEVKASLWHSRGIKSQQEGKQEDAIREFRESLAVYASVAENSSTLNNSALVHFSLYQLTQDREQFQRGSDKLDRALALRPSDSILLSNATALLTENVARDLIGPALDFKVLKRGAGTDLLSYLYSDQAGKNRYVVRLRDHAGWAKVKGYSEKQMVLAPRRVDSYSHLARIFEYLNDLDGLKSVAGRLRGVELDQAQARQEMLDFLAGKKDEKQREEIKKALSRFEEVYTAARKGGGPTLAVAACQLVSMHIAASMYGLPVDADKLVKLTEEADAAAPSSATKNMRTEALKFRAHLRLNKEDLEYQAVVKKHWRSMGPLVLTLVLSRSGPLRDKALANADIKQSTKLLLGQLKAFPEGWGATTWAFLQATAPEEAAKLAAKLKDNERESVERTINQILSPYSTATMLEEYWALQLAGKQDEAQKLLQEHAKKGIPLLE
jgi:hypothetical protein